MAHHDPFDFTKFLGGNLGFGMPGMVTPTLDPDELDKRIKDLKAVEGWLSMNLSMLQMSIQGLEVQRNTLFSLKAMGEAFNQSMNDVTEAAKRQAAESTPEHETAPSPETEVSTPVWPWDMAARAMADFQQQFKENAGKAAYAMNPSTAPAAAPEVAGAETVRTPAESSQGAETAPPGPKKAARTRKPRVSE